MSAPDPSLPPDHIPEEAAEAAPLSPRPQPSPFPESLEGLPPSAPPSHPHPDPDPDPDRPRPRSPFPSARNGYSQVSIRDHDDASPQSPEVFVPDHSETDPLYPPPPIAYYRQGFPVRVTHWGRLIITLLAIAFACFAIDAVIDVSSPLAAYEPRQDARSIADGVLAAMDRSADPCEDFYEYSCGSWLRSTNIPADRTSYAKSFSVVYDRVQLQVRDLLEKDMQNTDDAVSAKAGSVYLSCLDQHGAGPVNTLFLSQFRDDFNDLSTAKDFARLMSKLFTYGSATLYDMGVGLDDMNPLSYAIFLGQMSLGLPHRDNYLQNSDRDVEMRQHYLDLIVQLLDPAGRAKLVPRQDHQALAKEILDFETKVANFSLPPEEMRDPIKMYNMRNISDMPASLNLPEFFEGLSIDPSLANNSVIIDNPPFYDAMGQVMASLDTDDSVRRAVRGYLAFHVSRRGASLGLLGKEAYDNDFKMTQFVYGTKQMSEKWKICQSFTTSLLGDAVGMAFVKKYFKDSQLNEAKTLATLITQSFGKTLKTLEWMDDPTRSAAESKLSAINWKVGYSSDPDTYDDVVISPDSLTKTFESVSVHSTKRSIGHLGKPADKTEWFMNFQEVNAYYSPVRNEMVFPAGILQPPFFSDAYPDAMNFGAIGAVVGHEMSHGFDSSGRQYDKDGFLRSWWTNASAEEYSERSQCYVDLYNTFKPRDVDVYVNGALTLDENIADTNGVNVAFQAFKSIGNNSEDGIPPPNGLLAKELTNDQLFFVSFAQNWCTLYRPEALKVQMMTDPHSPGMFRVLGPLSQSDIFAKAFQCRNDSRYNPVKKCHLW